ncbi:fatty acyl-AMP ligase [Archangium minus]|uniref:Fatty acyl-AMP ligase n=2 Tax=Archangium minus TaxID=83450 RepID=A0ABY9WSG3_9BACT|nr:fatty acyl-AMP ligase [Archangium minus]
MESASMSLFDVLVRHASERPDATAYVFLESDGSRNSLTFSQLSRRARAIAARLQEAGASGERAILMYLPGLDFIEAILACFAAGVVAVPVQPLRNARDLPRLARIMGDAGSRFLLTHTAVRPSIQRILPDGDSALSGMTWLSTDTVPESAADEFRHQGFEPSRLAFLQYTSGSTGLPKGVMVNHGNLLHNEEMVRGAFGHDERTVFAGWLPLYHDMGLIGNVFQPLYLGIPSVLFAPTVFLMSPVTWLRTISDWRATTSGAPSFAYELCVHRVSPEDMQGVDLSSWKVAFNGAEPVKAQVINAFSRKFAPYGFREEAFYPCYGMAEATLFVTGGAPTAKTVQVPVEPEALARNLVTRQEDSSTVLVGCGTPHGGQVVRVVDPESFEVLPDGRIGELWISGDSVAAGYWARPDATAATFQARTSRGEGPFLRTGDLGFWQDGELFVTGRLKDLIIIRGRNHYPQDIEATVSGCHEALRPGGAAAFTVDGEEETKLVVIAEVHRTAVARLTPELQQAILAKARKEVSELYGLRLADLVLIKPPTLPKTTSGKVRRSYCRELYLSDRLERVFVPARKEEAEQHFLLAAAGEGRGR